MGQPVAGKLSFPLAALQPVSLPMFQSREKISLHFRFRSGFFVWEDMGIVSL